MQASFIYRHIFPGQQAAAQHKIYGAVFARFATTCSPSRCTAIRVAYLSVFRIEYTLTPAVTAALPGSQLFSMYIGRAAACIAAQCCASCSQPLPPSKQYVSTLMTKMSFFCLTFSDSFFAIAANSRFRSAFP